MLRREFVCPPITEMKRTAVVKVPFSNKVRANTFRISIESRKENSSPGVGGVKSSGGERRERMTKAGIIQWSRSGLGGMLLEFEESLARCSPGYYIFSPRYSVKFICRGDVISAQDHRAEGSIKQSNAVTNQIYLSRGQGGDKLCCESHSTAQPRPAVPIPWCLSYGSSRRRFRH